MAGNHLKNWRSAFDRLRQDAAWRIPFTWKRGDRRRKLASDAEWQNGGTQARPSGPVDSPRVSYASMDENIPKAVAEQLRYYLP
jgi:hypothetical protein